MTSATDTAQSPHPDALEISDLTEGLLPPARETALRQHIGACEQCGDIHASLEEIRSLLGDTSLREPMPDDVAERIDVALAAEATASGQTARPETAVSRETYEPSVEGTATARPAGRPRGATGPGRQPSGRRRRRVILGAAFGAAAVGISVFLLQSFQPSQNGADSAADHRVGAAAKSQGDFSDGSLEGRVQTLLSEAAPSEPSGYDPGNPSLDTKSSPADTSPDVATPRTPLRAPVVNVPPCVQEGTGRDAAALALEEGSYDGTAAFLVVMPHPTDSSRVTAYIVDAACVGSAPAAKGQLLLTHSYTRP